MQRERTIEFWNNFHQLDDHKEWILLPTDQLLDRLLSYVENSSHHPMILEVGCGTSQLSRCLYERDNYTASFVVTDVSPVCIEINRKRDAAMLSDRFNYQVLNALEPEVSSLNQKFNFVLDKGCLDTFLFRSSKGSHLVTKLLNNVLQWLLDDGQYLVLTPRPKIAILRDFPGFETVQRVVLDDSNATLGDLDGATAGKQVVYLHICTKRNSYITHDTANDDEQQIPQQCDKCGMTFDEFRRNETHVKIERRWTGHRVHCQGF